MRQNTTALGFIWIVAVFVLLFSVLAVIVGIRWWRSTGQSGLSKPLSSRSQPRALGQGFSLVFFGLFALIGGGLTCFLFFKSVWGLWEAQSWTPVPCVIVSSSIENHRGDDSTTYRLKIEYTYRVNGQEYRSERFGLAEMSSNLVGWRQDALRRFPPGSERTCYVNPRHPAEAVLHRGWIPDLWFGLIPLVFLLVGVGGLIVVLRRWGSGGAPTALTAFLPTPSPRGRFGRTIPPDPETVTPMSGPVALKSTATPLARFLGALVMAIFWNGILSVFWVQVFRGGFGGGFSWLLTLFLLPFTLVGLAFIAAVVHSGLSLANPGVRLVAQPGAVPLGGTLDLEWSISGWVHFPRRLRICLEGREEATYTRGTDTVTDKSVFCSAELVNTTSASEMRSGQVRFQVPPDTMHTCPLTHNKILWEIQVRGDIERWPDIQVDFKLDVLPQPLQPSAIS